MMEPGEKAMSYFSENVDNWGAAEWFNRLASAIRDQDRAVVAGDDISLETFRMIAASSAMTLVREHEDTVRTALVRLSDAEARIATLEAALSSAKDDVDLWQHRSSVWKKRAEEEEARAEAAEALLKEAGKALEPLCARADKWSLNSDSARVSVRLGHLRAARAIHDKIGVKDE